MLLVPGSLGGVAVAARSPRPVSARPGERRQGKGRASSIAQRGGCAHEMPAVPSQLKEMTQCCREAGVLILRRRMLGSC
jgi:hypothetical protein